MSGPTPSDVDAPSDVDGPFDVDADGPALRLFGCMTPNVLKVMWLLGELDLPYELRHVRVYAGETFADGFDRLHPLRRLPVLVDRDGPGGQAHTVFESGAILLYLAERAGRFGGRDAAERSHVVQWLMLQMSSVGPAFGNAVHFRGQAPADQAYARRRFATQGARLCASYDRRLAQSRFLAGADLTIADMATFPWLWRHPGMVGLDMTGHPHLTRWLDEIVARPGLRRALPAYRRMVAIDRRDAASAPAALIDRILGRDGWFVPD